MNIPDTGTVKQDDQWLDADNVDESTKKQSNDEEQFLDQD